MADYKHIERCIGSYIAAEYHNPVEIGIGANSTAAVRIRDSGVFVRCMDIRDVDVPEGLVFFRDDIFTPTRPLYENADVLYAIRPAEEMIPPMITLAAALSCDLLVYHLGFESYGDGGERIDCGVLLHRYYKAGSGVMKTALS